MFRMRRCSPTFLKLTTICEVSHVISSTRPSSPFFFPTRGRPGDEARFVLMKSVAFFNMCDSFQFVHNFFFFFFFFFLPVCHALVIAVLADTSPASLPPT